MIKFVLKFDNSAPVLKHFTETYNRINQRVQQMVRGKRSIQDDDQNTMKPREKRQLMLIFSVGSVIVDLFSKGKSLYDHMNQAGPIDLKPYFQKINVELDEIRSGLSELMRSIKDTSIRRQYLSAQRVILESYRILDYYTTVEETYPTELDYWKSEFAKWGSLLRESILFLLDGMLGHNAIAGDIIENCAIVEQVISKCRS